MFMNYYMKFVQKSTKNIINDILKNQQRTYSFIHIIYENTKKDKRIFRNKHENHQIRTENQTRKPRKNLKIIMFIFK